MCNQTLPHTLPRTLSPQCSDGCRQTWGQTNSPMRRSPAVITWVITLAITLAITFCRNFCHNFCHNVIGSSAHQPCMRAPTRGTPPTNLALGFVVVASSMCDRYRDKYNTYYLNILFTPKVCVVAANLATDRGVQHACKTTKSP
jgi:hypothetical protein